MGRGSFKFRLFLVLYLLVIYVLGSVHGQNDIPTTTVGACHRRPNGFARDLENCASYFICQNGQAIRGRCPGNMLFDAANEVCWWREDVTCFQCPRNEVYALLPVQNTCFQFYMCWMGRATIHSCPSLLVFDPKLRRCNFPMGTGCEGDDEINEGCPPVDGANPVYLAHATSCTLYYVCSSGIPLERQCAQGLHFNPILRICDIPANANCGAGGDHPDLSDESGEIGPGDEDQLGIPCPDNGHAFRPHRDNCNAYFACSNGETTLVNCAPGLHFDYVRSTCDRPRNTKCWSRENPPLPPSGDGDWRKAMNGTSIN